MKPLIVLLLFLGMALVMHGVYEDKYRRLEETVRVEYRFIPRTLYEEQMAETDLVGKFGSMFEPTRAKGPIGNPGNPGNPV